MKITNPPPRKRFNAKPAHATNSAHLHLKFDHKEYASEYSAQEEM